MYLTRYFLVLPSKYIKLQNFGDKGVLKPILTDLKEVCEIAKPLKTKSTKNRLYYIEIKGEMPVEVFAFQLLCLQILFISVENCFNTVSERFGLFGVCLFFRGGGVESNPL